MSPSTSFHDPVWLNRHVSIPGDPDTWQPIAKVHDRSSPEPLEEFNGHFCWGSAESLVQSIQNPGREGYLKVLLQIPIAGTEGHPDHFRAQQATTAHPPPQASELLGAWKRLTALDPPVTGQLIGYKETLQSPDDPVPNGWAFYLLVSKPPGVRLGTGERGHKDGYRVHEGIFWDMPMWTRDLIRARLEEAYRRLYDAQISHWDRELGTLYWDDKNQKLYLHGVFEPTGPPYVHRGVPFMKGMLAPYGLVKDPVRPRRGFRMPDDPTLEELAEAGWLF